MVQFVDAVISQEKLQCPLNETLIIRIAQGAPNQHRGPVPHVAGDNVCRQVRPVIVLQHGVDRVHQVQPGVH